MSKLKHGGSEVISSPIFQTTLFEEPPMRQAQRVSTESYAPDHAVTNVALVPRFGENVDDWLVKNGGIREQRFMHDDQVTSDLAVAAGRVALE